MATVNLTSTKHLEELIESSDTLFIDFWAEWCGPCKMFGPVFEEASDNNEKMIFAKCDTEAQQEIAAQFGIRSIPTLAIFREGILIFMQPGALPAPAFADLIEKVKEIDMEEVRSEIEKEKAAKA
ncbi:MAG: thioredoxin [Deltaproteobacteria bacterium]|nr:thioredoxin [Deltaproteobacteria bacterium]